MAECASRCRCRPKVHW